MADVTPQMIKDLRERTGAGMSDCKKALTECAADMDKAIEFLRKKGIASAAKKSARIASEGTVATYLHGSRIAVLVGGHGPLGGDAPRLLRQGGHPLLAQVLDGLVHVGGALGERLLAVGEAGAGALAELGDHLGSNVSHDSILVKKSS